MAGSGIARRRSAALDEGSAAYTERRREVIQAAGRVFKRKGYKATSLNDIARELGTDRATIYYYVSGKAELFDSAVSAAVEANALQAEETRSGSEPGPAKLRALITALMESYAANYPHLYVYVQEDLSQVEEERLAWAERMRRLNHRYEEALIGVIRDGMEDGSLRRVGDPRTVAYGLLGMLAWTNRWFRPGDYPIGAGEIAAVFASTVLDGLAAG